MIRSITALAILGLLGAAVVALPASAPQVEASETIILTKADQSAIRPIAQNCLQQIWPNFDTSCLRSGDSSVMILEARLVTARR
jgi:hypothetical protein